MSSFLNPNNRIDARLSDMSVWYTQVGIFNNGNIIIVYDGLAPNYLLYKDENV